MPSGVKQLGRVAGKRRHVAACLAVHVLADFNARGDFDHRVESGEILTDAHRIHWSLGMSQNGKVDYRSRVVFTWQRFCSGRKMEGATIANGLNL